MNEKTLRAFDVCVGTEHGRAVHQVLAASSMAAYQLALRSFIGTNASSDADVLRSLVVKPR